MADTTTTPVANAIYSHVVNGVKYYETLPDYNVAAGSGLTKVTDPQEVKDYITHLNSLGTYVPFSQTGPQFDTAAVAKGAQDALNTFYSSPNSGYVLDKNGVFTTQKSIDDAATHEAAAAAGTERNIGTAEAPLYVTVGSPGDLLNQGLKSGAVNPQDPNQQFAASSKGVIPPGTTPVAPNAAAPQGQPINAAGAQNNTPASASAQGQGQSLADLIGTRPSPSNPQQTEYFNKLTGAGFPDQPSLFKFLQQATGQNFTDLSQVDQAISGSQNQSGTQQLSDGTLAATSNTDPMQSFVDQYNEVYTSLGLPTLKSQIEDFTQQYTDLQNELNDKISDVNENPWLSEGVRRNQIKALQNRYDLKLKPLNDHMKLAQALYDKGVSQAQFIAGKAAALDQQKTEKAQSIAQTQANHEASLAAKTIKLKDGTLLQYDPVTQSYGPAQNSSGKTISNSSNTPSQTPTQALNYAANKIDTFLQSVRGKDGFVSPEDYKSARNAWVADKFPVAKFDSQFKKYINSADPQDY